jgi:hypothetical protein
VRADDEKEFFAARYNHSAVNFDDKMWIIGGLSGSPQSSVYSSEDGQTWTEVRATSDAGGFDIRYGHASVVFDDKMWVIGGLNFFRGINYLNDVWSSTNGETWTEVTADSSAKFTARQNHKSVVFNDGSGEKIWVIGGTTQSGSEDDVWSSTDGKTWTEVTAGSSAKFTYRSAHTAVNFDNKLWVIGGTDSGNKSDVWNSTNGKTWTEVTTSARFTARNGHSSVNFDNKLWVIGGTDGGNKSDVWNSTNGKTWTEMPDDAGFADRFGHQSVVFNNRVWLISGFGSDFFNDVWSMVKD